MLAVKIQIVWLKITLESVHVNREQRVIRYWAVFQFNTVQPIISVHRERFAKLEFVQLFVHRIVNVSPINFACKEFANQLVTIIQLVPTSNFVKTTFAHKRFGAAAMVIAYQMNGVKLIHTADPSAKMLARDAYYVDEMLNAQHEITMHYAHANKVLSMMVKADAEELNAKEILTVQRINSVKRMFVN